MGARISVQFQKGEQKSVVLFSHWGGERFLKEAEDYTDSIKNRERGGISRPLDRLEPSTVMVDFTRHVTKDMEEVSSDLYFGKDEEDGDNSDYGHHIILLDT